MKSLAQVVIQINLDIKLLLLAFVMINIMKMEMIFVINALKNV